MKYFIILFILCFLSSTCAIGQCCTAGNPSGGDGSNDGLNKNELRIFTSNKYSLSKQYFYHDSKADIPYIEKSYYNYQNLSLTYGVLPRLSLHTEVGYFFDKAQLVNINNEKENISSHGLGDFAFNIRYIALKTVKPLSQLVFSGGIKVPIGVFNEEINGITIPISLQPSSGALKGNASVFYSRKRADKKIGWNSYALFEISNTINKGYLVYKYGNYFLFAFAGTYSINKNLNCLINTKFEWRGYDKRESDIEIVSSGSKVLYINPQLIYTLKQSWSMILMCDIPLHKYVNGYQLTNKFSTQIGIRKNFSFCKKVK